ncbi:MAG: alkane 1-monooxygenase [Lysobacterales bacterium]
MKTYQYHDPICGLIEYRDQKRYLWLLAVAFPLIPFVAMGLMAWTGLTWTLWGPLVAIYVLLPLLDFGFSNDSCNPPEQVVHQLEADPYYRYLIYAAVALHIVALIGGAWFVANYQPHWLGLLGLGLLVGAISGSCLNLGHELGHKKLRADQLMAQLALAVPFYGHFTVEHNAGHHSQVATPEDSASARFGENIYRFALREIPGGLRRGWHLEQQRLARKGYRCISWRNQILQSYAISALLFGSLIAFLGAIVVPYLVIQTAFAWWQLTSANYVEHYGLLRARAANGRYERCQPHHSWNANHLASNLVMFHLERHSDHHAFASRRYQSLRHYEDVPQLPSGYFGMFVLAYLPPLWFRVMNPKVLDLAAGDLLRVNLDPAWRKLRDEAPLPRPSSAT